MEMARTRQEAKEESREALIAAGMELFGAEGLDGPSLDAICARAGYTRGAFYVHFRDRDDFLQAVMERVGVSFLDALFADANDLAGAMARFVEAMVSGAYPLTAPGGVRPHQLLEACARSPEIRRRYVALIGLSLERVAELVRAGQARRVLRRDLEPGQTATLLLAVVIGIQTMMELDVPIDLGRGAASLLKLLQ
jgi:AcrR family transcriptional regulator